MPASWRHTKIVCTIGPASRSPEMLHALVEAGMDCARLNFSHAEYEEFEAVVGNLRKLSREKRKNLAVLGDLCGPRVRVGVLERPLQVAEGEAIILSSPKKEVGEGEVPIYPEVLFECVSEGQTILLSGGEVEGVVEERKEGRVKVRLTRGGTIRSNVAINVPGVDLPLPVLTEKDKHDLKWAIEHGLDWLAISFVRSGKDVEVVREELKRLGHPDVKVMAKVECASSLGRAEEIVEAADGLMIARGDLGLEVPIWEVPLQQKRLIGLCNRAGKPVVTATQMLESMVDRPLPARSDVSDVANAVLDGTDAVMLSEETAVGKYPVEAVRVMASVICEVEKAYPHQRYLREGLEGLGHNLVEAVAQAACEMADKAEVKVILTPTRTGLTARMVAKRRPKVPILAVTTNESVARELAPVWGVRTTLLERAETVDQLIYFSAAVACREGILSPGDLAVITAGTPPWVTGNTNVIKLHRVGQALVKGEGRGKGCYIGEVTHNPKEATNKVLVVHDPSETLPEGATCVVVEGAGNLPAGVMGVVGAGKAKESLKEGQLVVVDCEEGVVYEAEGRLRPDEG